MDFKLSSSIFLRISNGLMEWARRTHSKAIFGQHQHHEGDNCSFLLMTVAGLPFTKRNGNCTGSNPFLEGNQQISSQFLAINK